MDAPHPSNAEDLAEVRCYDSAADFEGAEGTPFPTPESAARAAGRRD
jgi:hypothetical protein